MVRFCRISQPVFTAIPELKNFSLPPITEGSSFPQRLAQFYYDLWFLAALNPVRRDLPLRTFRRISRREEFQAANRLAVGAGCIVRKEVFDRIGLYDEEFIYYGEDSDFTLRLNKAGIDIWFCPQIRIIHYHRPNLRLLIKRQFVMGKNVLIFQRKWPRHPIFITDTLQRFILFTGSPVRIALHGLCQADSLEGFFIFPTFLFILRLANMAGYLWAKLNNGIRSSD